MKIQITSEVTLSDGSTAAGIIGTLKLHVDELLSTGKGLCDIIWHRDVDAQEKGYENIWPVKLDKDGKVLGKVATGSIGMTQNESNAAYLPKTIFDKFGKNIAEQLGAGTTYKILT